MRLARDSPSIALLCIMWTYLLYIQKLFESFSGKIIKLQWKLNRVSENKDKMCSRIGGSTWSESSGNFYCKKIPYLLQCYTTVADHWTLWKLNVFSILPDPTAIGQMLSIPLMLQTWSKPMGKRKTKVSWSIVDGLAWNNGNEVREMENVQLIVSWFIDVCHSNRAEHGKNTEVHSSLPTNLLVAVTFL